MKEMIEKLEAVIQYAEKIVDRPTVSEADLKRDLSLHRIAMKTVINNLEEVKQSLTEIYRP